MSRPTREPYCDHHLRPEPRRGADTVLATAVQDGSGAEAHRLRPPRSAGRPCPPLSTAGSTPARSWPSRRGMRPPWPGCRSRAPAPRRERLRARGRWPRARASAPGAPARRSSPRSPAGPRPARPPTRRARAPMRRCRRSPRPRHRGRRTSPSRDRGRRAAGRCVRRAYRGLRRDDETGRIRRAGLGGRRDGGARRLRYDGHGRRRRWSPTVPSEPGWPARPARSRRGQGQRVSPRQRPRPSARDGVAVTTPSTSVGGEVLVVGVRPASAPGPALACASPWRPTPEYTIMPFRTLRRLR